MTISTLDGIVASTKRRCGYYKNTGQPTQVAGAFHSLWAAGPIPAAGSLSVGNTTSGAVPTSATTGAMSDFIDPSGNNCYLGALGFMLSTAVSLILADRVWHAGSFTPTSGSMVGFTGATVVDRPSTGAGIEAWVEINTGFNANAHTITLTYVNQAGTGSRTATCVVPASAISGRMFPFTLQAGDSGIRSISVISGSASPPTGSYNIVLLRRLAVVAAQASGADVIGIPETGMPELFASSCLFGMTAAVSTTAPTVWLDPLLLYG